MLYILKTDNVSPEVLAQEGDYGVIFTDRMRKAGYTGDIKIYDVVNRTELPEPSELKSSDTVLITGSKSDAWSDEPWILALVKFTTEIIDRARIVGICFGHQIVARALGAPMGRAREWELSVCPITLTEEGKRVFTEAQAPSVIELHHDQVFELPANTELLASSPICPIQAFYRANSLLCVQWHPEFNQFMIDSICKMRFSGDQLADALARSSGRQHGAEINKTIVRFINGQL